MEQLGKRTACQIPVNSEGWVRSKEQKLIVQKFIAQHGAFLHQSASQFKAVTTKIYGSEHEQKKFYVCRNKNSIHSWQQARQAELT